MKVQIKTIQGSSAYLNLEPSRTVDDMKNVLSQYYDFDAGAKIVHKGKITLGSDTLESLKYDSGDFLVVVGKRAKGLGDTKDVIFPSKELPHDIALEGYSKVFASSSPPPATSSTTTNSAATPTPALDVKTADVPTSASAPAAEAPAPAPSPLAPTVQPTVQPPVAAVGAVSAPAGTASEVEVAITSLMEATGFPREQVQRAMRAAFNNPDRACEYLFSGNIPNVNEAPSRPVQQGGPPRPATNPVVAQPEDMMGDDGMEEDEELTPEMMAQLQQFLQQGGGGGANQQQLAQFLMQQLQQQQQPIQQSPLEQALRSVPQFEQLRQMIIANPAMLASIVPQLQQSNPQLFQLIQANPQEFVRIMSGQPAPQAQGGNANPAAALQQAAAGGQVPPGAQVVQVTPAEREAIERLVALGFQREQAIEAFLVCGKNEEAAANFLFDNQF